MPSAWRWNAHRPTHRPRYLNPASTDAASWLSPAICPGSCVHVTLISPFVWVLSMQVLAAMEALAAGRTSVFVAHRLSTAAQCDQIVVLDAGHVAEAGECVAGPRLCGCGDSAAGVASLYLLASCVWCTDVLPVLLQPCQAYGIRFELALTLPCQSCASQLDPHALMLYCLDHPT